MLSDREKRRSYGNDRALNPSISEVELDSLCSSERAYNFQRFNRKLSVGSIGEDIVIDKTVATKLVGAVKSPRLTPAKAPATPGRQATPKISNTGSDRDLVSSQQTDGVRN